MALVDTARGMSNILANRIKIDMSNEIALLEPTAMPFTTILNRLKTRSAVSVKHEWMEDAYMSRWTQINYVSGYAAGATSLVVDTGEGALFAVNDLAKVTRTGEIMLVTGISTDTLTVIRGYGTTAAAAIVDDDKILVIGNASMQGSGASAEKYNSLSPVYNYCQIIKTPFSVTNTLDAVSVYGPSEYDRLANKKGVEHGISIENALLFGERKLDTSGAQPRGAMSGLATFLAGTVNVQSTASSGSNAVIQAAINTWVSSLFTYGSQEKTWFAGSAIIDKVTAIAGDKLQLVQADMDKTFGLNITKWMTPHGMLNIVKHPLFVKGYASYSMAVDMANVEYMPLRDTSLEQNIQNNDEDGRKDQFLTESTVEVRLPLTHGIFTLT